MPPIPRVPHTATWVYFTSRLPDCFSRSSKAVKEVIMTDINCLVQESWTTSSDEAVGSSFFAMRRLFEILQRCFVILEVCFDIISVHRPLSTLLIKIYRCRTLTKPNSEPNSRYCLMGIERSLISHSLNPKICVTCSGPYLVL